MIRNAGKNPTFRQPAIWTALGICAQFSGLHIYFLTIPGFEDDLRWQSIAASALPMRISGKYTRAITVPGMASSIITISWIILPSSVDRRRFGKARPARDHCPYSRSLDGDPSPLQ
jgi:hypothetical protein